MKKNVLNVCVPFLYNIAKWPLAMDTNRRVSPGERERKFNETETKRAEMEFVCVCVCVDVREKKD